MARRGGTLAEPELLIVFHVLFLLKSYSFQNSASEVILGEQSRSVLLFLTHPLSDKYGEVTNLKLYVES